MAVITPTSFKTGTIFEQRELVYEVTRRWLVESEPVFRVIQTSLSMSIITDYHHILGAPSELFFDTAFDHEINDDDLLSFYGSLEYKNSTMKGYDDLMVYIMEDGQRKCVEYWKPDFFHVTQSSSDDNYSNVIHIFPQQNIQEYANKYADWLIEKSQTPRITSDFSMLLFECSQSKLDELTKSKCHFVEEFT